MTSGSRTILAATRPLHGALTVPGDKSLAHRAVLFNAAARGSSVVRGLPEGRDVRSSIAAMRSLGCRIDDEGPGICRIEGRALEFEASATPIDCGNSGTTIRLMMGLLAGQSIRTSLCGDASLSRRPMERVAGPLRTMGARISTTDGHAPVTIEPANLTGERHALSVASAQIKSAILLAGLSATGETVVREPGASRDHTERMLSAMGVAVTSSPGSAALCGPIVPSAIDIDVAGDPSSAAFLLVAALLVPGSEVTVRQVCLNPTRTGFLRVLDRMGADIRVQATGHLAGEPIGDLTARACDLGAFQLEADEVPGTIDELPLLAVAAARAEGRSVIRGAGELRVKESDRVASTVAMLHALGVNAVEKDDGMEIEGGLLPGGGIVDGADDHRIVMCATVAALAAREPVTIGGVDAAAVSYPNFFDDVEKLRT